MKRATAILWAIVAAYALLTFVITVFPGVIPTLALIVGLTFLPVAFALPQTSSEAPGPSARSAANASLRCCNL